MMKEDMNHVLPGHGRMIPYHMLAFSAHPRHPRDGHVQRNLISRGRGVEKGRATLSNSSSSMLPSSRDQIHTAQDRTHGTAEVGIIAAGYLLQVVKAEEMPHIVMFFPN